MFIHDELNVRSFRKEGLLSDEPADNKWYDGLVSVASNLWSKAQEDPYGVGAKYGIEAVGCLGGNAASCVKMGEKLCDEEKEPIICGMATAGRLALSEDTPPPTIKPINEDARNQELRSKLNEVLDIYKGIPCDELTSTMRDDLITKLNEYAPRFKDAGMESEFNSALKRLTCDVVKEYKCDGRDASVVQFTAEPVCRPSFMQAWGKPLAIGGVSGTAVGFGYHKIAKGPVTHSVIAGVLTCGVVTYYLRSNMENNNG